jgi:hypothetical protein
VLNEISDDESLDCVPVYPGDDQNLVEQKVQESEVLNEASDDCNEDD